MAEIKTNPNTNCVFEEPWWLDLVAPGNWSEALVKDGEKTLARLPYVVGKGGISMPVYTQTLGIWMDEELRRPARGNEHLARQKEVIRELLGQLPVKKNIELSFHCSQEYVLPFRWEGFDITPTFSYRISHEKEKTEIESAFGKGVRRDINRGKRELLLDEEASAEEFISLQNQTYSRQGRKNPVENEITLKVIRTAIEAGHGKLLLARDREGIAHAGVFVVYDNKTCYNLMSGQNTAFGNDCSMPFLLDNAIAFSAEKSACFDFEGSMIEGIEQVYRRYGGTAVINWYVAKRSFFGDVLAAAKPRVKKILKYRM